MARIRPPEFRPALLVIDMQNGFCTCGGSYEKYGGTIGADLDAYRHIIPNIARLLEAARELGIPIFYTQQVREESGIDLFTRLHRIVPERRAEYLRIPACIRGTWDAEIIDELKPQPGDIVVNKHRYNGFTDTELDTVLGTYNIKYLLFVGLATNVCVESTLRDAYFHEYFPVLISDGCGNIGPEFTQEATIWNVTEVFGWVTTFHDLVKALE